MHAYEHHTGSQLASVFKHRLTDCTRLDQSCIVISIVLPTAPLGRLFGLELSRASALLDFVLTLGWSWLFVSSLGRSSFRRVRCFARDGNGLP